VSAQEPTVRVRLLGIPLDLHRRAGEHQEALRRELAFVEHLRDERAAPARLRALTADLRQRYGGLMVSQTERLHEALEAGEATIDLEYELPPEIVQATVDLDALLDELDELCRAGDLLTVVTPPELVVYRRWLVGQIVGQVRDGRPPEPWQPIAVTGSGTGSTRSASTPVRVVVDDDLDLGTAAALRQVLVDHIDRGAVDITVDLTACEFLDSTGLSLLVTTHHRLRDVGGGLRLHGASGQVAAVLELAGTTDFFGSG
jgi:anti-anti-sigma factor